MKLSSQEYLLSRDDGLISGLKIQDETVTAPIPQRSLLSLLCSHFLERFFNHEMVSSDEDGKARLLQVACAAGVPGFVVALYLWAPYHPLKAPMPAYWQQVAHHFFFVIYSFVVMGIVTVFEWDLFFPDLLDVAVLTPLPLKRGSVFLARILAVSIFVLGFLFDTNILATFLLPVSIEPPHPLQFAMANLLAASGSGIFAAALVLIIQGMFIAILGESFVRKISFALQGLIITSLLILLMLFPVLSGILSGLMQSGNKFVFAFPPFWFLGVYQYLLEGPSSQPIYFELARIGCTATALAVTMAILLYPIAYWRKTGDLILGGSRLRFRTWSSTLANRMLHFLLLRKIEYRAIFHFISQTILRVHRYRIYLIMYGGLGLAIITANVLRLNIYSKHIHIGLSSDGLRAAVPIAAFWIVTGLRLTFLSPGNQRGNWIFRLIQGRPNVLILHAAKIWVYVCSMTCTLGIVLVSRFLAPCDLEGWRISCGQIVTALGLCLLLTDLFFLNVKIIPFTGIRAEIRPNLAITLLKYFSFFPLTIWLTLRCGPWIERNAITLIATTVLIAVIHSGLQIFHRKSIEHHLSLPEFDEESEFLLKLGISR